MSLHHIAFEADFFDYLLLYRHTGLPNLKVTSQVFFEYNQFLMS